MSFWVFLKLNDNPHFISIIPLLLTLVSKRTQSFRSIPSNDQICSTRRSFCSIDLDLNIVLCNREWSPVADSWVCPWRRFVWLSGGWCASQHGIRSSRPQPRRSAWSGTSFADSTPWRCWSAPYHTFPASLTNTAKNFRINLDSLEPTKQWKHPCDSKSTMHEEHCGIYLDKFP